MVKTMVDSGFVRQEYLDMMVLADNPADLVDRFRSYTHPREKWA